MRTHFDIEDNLIASALKPYRDSNPKVAKALGMLDEQHILLHKLTSTTQASSNEAVTATQVKALGSLLYDHIRFEERELFPLAESHLTEEELDAIYNASSDSVKRIEENR